MRLLQIGVLFLTLAALPGFCRAQTLVRVHMIDARTENVVTSKAVGVWVFNKLNYGKRPGYLEEKTDAHGIATFRISDPVSTYLIIHAQMGGYWEECSTPKQANVYPMDEILSSGISREGDCTPPGLRKIDIKARPGEIYLFVTHLSLLERMKYCHPWGCRQG